MKSRLMIIFLGLFIFSVPAMAYIDPGSGSALMSAVIGFLVAIGMAVKTYWYKLKSLFSGKKKSNLLLEDAEKPKKEAQ